MYRASDAFRGQRSVFTTRRHAAYPALTYAFSIGLDRGQATDDFVRRIIARLCAAWRLSNRLTAGMDADNDAGAVWAPARVGSEGGQPRTNPRSVRAAAGASRREPPFKGLTYRWPAFAGTTDITSS